MTRLTKGQIGRIATVDGPAHITRRLAEMGVTPGATVEMLRPGRPCILRVNRTRLSIGHYLQSHIRVLSESVEVAMPSGVRDAAALSAMPAVVDSGLLGGEAVR